MFAETDDRHKGEPWFVVESKHNTWGCKEVGWFIAWACSDPKEAKEISINRGVPSRIWKVTGEIVFNSEGKNTKQVQTSKPVV